MLVEHGADASLQDKYARTAMVIKEAMKVVDKKTAVITDGIFLEHHTCDPSMASSINAPPENKHRLEVLMDPLNGILRSSDLKLVFEEMSPRADMADVLRVHDWSYIRKVQGTCEAIADDELGRLDGDTTLSSESFEAALHAAGAVCRAIDLVVEGHQSRIQNAFCAIRPPGHHSGPKGVVSSETGSDSHGFCLLNNIAIGASYALHVHRKVFKRVAIIDFDVHHGNGTEECVRWLRPGIDHAELTRNDVFGALSMPRYKPWLNEEDADNVLFVSVHGYGPREKGLEHMFPLAAFYPGTGKTQFPHAMKKKTGDEDKLIIEGKALGVRGMTVGGRGVREESAEMEGVTTMDKHDPDDDQNDEGDHEDDDDDDFEEDEDEEDSDPHSNKPISGSSRLKQLQAMYTTEAVSAFSDSLVLDIGVPLANYDIEADSLAAASYRNYWRNQFREEIFPRLIAFEPDLLLISAGFDAHKKVLSYLNL